MIENNKNVLESAYKTTHDKRIRVQENNLCKPVYQCNDFNILFRLS